MVLQEVRELTLPNEPIDRNDVVDYDDNYDEDEDKLMELIRNELEKFIVERNIERSISGSDNFQSQSPLYEVFTKDAATNYYTDEARNTPPAAVAKHEEIKNYEAPIVDDFKHLDTFRSPYNIEGQPGNNDVYSERGSERLLGSSYHQSDKKKDGRYLDQLAGVKPRPDKLLELIPQDQRNKYPVEVEEITYEEYLQLSKKGETFEEPLYEDLDKDIEEYDIYTDNMGFDTNNNIVTIKYEDALADLSRPRTSRRNDLDEFPTYFDKSTEQDGTKSMMMMFPPTKIPDKIPFLMNQSPQYMLPQARTLIMNDGDLHQVDISSNSIVDPRWGSSNGKIMEIPTGVYQIMNTETGNNDGNEEVVNMNDNSNRRMDANFDDYEYIDTIDDNEDGADAATTMLRDNIDIIQTKVNDNLEEIDVETSNDDIDEAAKQKTDDNEDDALKEQTDMYTTGKTTSFIPPRPVYVVYPDPDTPTSTTASTAGTSTPTPSSIASSTPSLGFSTKMFEIDYDQFS